MRSLATWVILAAACGKVGEAPPANVADAALDAFSCSADKLACNFACVDPMSDPMNCGGCGNTCQTGGESCQAGTCMDTAASCADIVAANPQALDGTYTFIDGTKANCDFSGTTSCSTIHTANPQFSGDGFYPLAAGSGIWCDMTEGAFNIYGLAYAEYSASLANYHIVSLFDYQSLGSAFITMFNQQSGNIPLAATWSLVSCCIKYDSSTAFLNLGSNNTTNSYSLVQACTATPSANVSFSVFAPGGSFVTEAAPLPPDFFTNFPATGVVSPSCNVNANPAFFWKETP